jgi:hypothetical protein
MDNGITLFVQRAINCQFACNMCFDACLEENDVKMLVDCIRYDRECADICGIAVDFVGRKGTLTKEILEACIKSCVTCAQECEKHEHMQHCQDCAVACNECADACRAIR